MPDRPRGPNAPIFHLSLADDTNTYFLNTNQKFARDIIE